MHPFLATCAILVLFFSACSTEQSPRRSAQQRDRADSIVGCVKGEQSLDSLVKEAEKSGDRMLEMRARRQLGRTYREDNFFMKAIECHQREMALGEQLHDTIAMAQALNNIGTNYRRMGILDEAINYHYRALHISEEFSYKDDRTARKNRVVSLNGIGNICLTLGDKETADSVFHAALEGEKSLAATSDRQSTTPISAQSSSRATVSTRLGCTTATRWSRTVSPSRTSAYLYAIPTSDVSTTSKARPRKPSPSIARRTR